MKRTVSIIQKDEDEQEQYEFILKRGKTLACEGFLATKVEGKAEMKDDVTVSKPDSGWYD